MKAVIIDDEINNSEVIITLLQRHCPHVEIVATANNGRSGYEMIELHKPDVVFLDIEMPGMDGFQMLEKFETVPFEVIFTTAYEQYAVRAIKFNALDYLLKPISPKELKESVAKAEERIKNKPSPDQMKVLLDHVHAHKENKPINLLALPTSEGLEIIKTHELIRLEADSRYTNLFLTENRKLLITKNLGEFEEILQKNDFVRVHKSHLINLDHVKKYVRGEGGQLLMTDDKWVDVSRYKKDELLKKLQG
ncbi:MAG: LytR/AlgR family response regulator transcription factor [Chitinophagales bacterium]